MRPQGDKENQDIEEEECEEIPAIARYIQELMEEEPTPTAKSGPPPLEPIIR